MQRKAPKLTRSMFVNRHSGSDRVAPTAENFPALKHFWDKNHISGAVLQDTVGTQHITSSEGHWYLSEEGFAKWTIGGDNNAPAKFEAPSNRDFMLIGCGRISLATRECTIGTVPGADASMSFDTGYPTSHAPNAYLDASNYTLAGQYSFYDDLPNAWTLDGNNNVQPYDTADPSNVGIWGCFATVINPTAGTCIGRWAGRETDTASYNVGYEEILLPVTGSIASPWPELGTLWTMFPGNRFEWVALMYFDSGAPYDMEEAMRWMAQYNDIRLYPGWVNKK